MLHRSGKGIPGKMNPKQGPPSAPSPSAKPPVPINEGWSWHNPQIRALIYQVLVLFGVIIFVYLIFRNTQINLQKQNIASGFSFLQKEAAFEIGESPFAYTSADSYLLAFGVGLLNTLKVSLVGIFLSVFLGTIVGLARISHNWLVRSFAGAYVEVIRNIPLLLQLFFWYALLSDGLPAVRDAMQPLPGIFLSQRGLVFPVLKSHTTYTLIGYAILLILFGLFFLRKWAQKRQDKTGLIFPFYTVAISSILVIPLLLWLIGGRPWLWEVPVVEGFNFVGGVTLSPEFLSLTLGLTLYTGAFVAEIVRSGIQAINQGQVEAALSLGLKRNLVLRLVILPQALRVIIPPLTGQMLGLTKNSSLAVAIGYPDFVSVANTSMNQTGQAIECVALIMLVYLTLSLTTSLFMNMYNERVKLVER